MELKQSLAYQLLKVTFAFYLLITVVITVIHMYTAWWQAEKYLEDDLTKLGSSSRQGIVLALWDIDYDQVDLIVEGLLDLPIVVGIEVKDRKISRLYGVKGDIKKQYQMIHEEEQGVVYEIGNMTMYSSKNIVFQRVKNGYLLTVVNAIIKTCALWVIVLLVGKKLITRPLTLLTEATQSIDPDDVDTFKEVDIGISRSKNELTLLQGAFNTMLHSLATDRKALNRINLHLETIVGQRTHELQMTNERMEQEVSAHKETEKELQIAKDKAEKANMAKSSFLANMSHELRTPLNAILGFSELMTRDSNLSQEQLKNLETIGASGEHLLSLINDVLELSKIEAGQVVLQLEDFDLYHLLTVIEDMFKLSAREKGLTFVVERSSLVPRFIRADQGRLRQSLINILGNAAKFTEQGNVALRVNCKGERLYFEIEDTGTGIAPEDLERVFDTFVQSDSSTGSKCGTGLGIPISQRFVELMGGTLTAESELGKGSIFRFDVRIERIGYVFEESVPEQRVVGLAEDQQKYRLLVVEDNESSRQLLVTLLREVGFEVRDAVDGRDAVAKWKSWQPHLVWMDIRMPEMDGYEATRNIRALSSGEETVIIALTAHAFEEDRVKVLESGCNDFVRKPFREDEILEMMQKYLGVRYLYEDKEPAIDIDIMENNQKEIGEAIAALPSELHKEFFQAVQLADFDGTATVIDKIGVLDQGLTSSLREMLETYQFDVLEELLKEK